LGIKVLRGRTIGEQDTAATRKVAVVNDAFARKFFKGQNPVGQHFGPGRLRYAGNYEIVGVVRDVRYMTWNVKDAVRPMFWVSETQSVQYDDPDFTKGEAYSHFLYNIAVWAEGNPAGVERQARGAIASIDPNLVIYDVNPYSKILSADFQQENMIATLTMLFGALGLVLAAVGLYGVMAYTVEQRTNEIGVRMALGADRRSVVGLVLHGAFSQIAIGLALGVPLALAAGKFMTKQLFGVNPGDPWMLAGSALMLCGAALLASWIPAARAAGVEPMVALRNE
jgi:predicted permease